jgi:hypothetical protein
MKILFIKFSIFKVDKFLQTLLKLEQWQKRPAVTVAQQKVRDDIPLFLGGKK